MSHVDVDPASREADGRPAQDDGFTRNFGLDDGQSLRQRMVRELGGGGGPQQISEIVTGELLARLEGEPDEKSQMLARTKPDLLASRGEQGGSPKTVQPKSVSHIPERVFLIRPRDKGSKSTKCQHVVM